MKEYIYNIYPSMIDYSSSIRDKITIINIIIEITRLLLVVDVVQFQEKDDINKIELTVLVDKMSRIFINENDKIHTFNYPFSIKEIDDKLSININQYNIDSTICSVLKTIFYKLTETESLEELLEKIWVTLDEYNIPMKDFDYIYKLVTYLFVFEPGYLRFDNDSVNQNGHMHPQNHIDFNYSNNVTFKIGLESSLLKEEFIDLININTSCAYITIKE